MADQLLRLRHKAGQMHAVFQTKRLCLRQQRLALGALACDYQLPLGRQARHGSDQHVQLLDLAQPR